MEQTNTGAGTPAKRPTFLTVLCILSFVAAGISIVASILGYLAMGVAEDMGASLGAGMAEGMEGMEGMDGAFGEAMNAANALAANAKTLLIIGIIVTLIALFGVIQMWKQKKMGFYIYTGAQVIGIIAPIIIVGMLGFSVFGTIISAAFIVMYGLNLKHMS